MTERKSLETERAELVDLADKLEAIALPDHGGADAGVGVKPLEWRPHISNQGWLVSDEPMPCSYFVWELSGRGYWSLGSIIGREVHDGIDGAKAAAQADYERRILSALSKPAPVAANASAEAAIRKIRRIVTTNRTHSVLDEVVAVCDALIECDANASAELQNDLAEMLRALGMSDAAQPKSPHEVFQSAIAEMKRQLTNASAEARLGDAEREQLLALADDYLANNAAESGADELIRQLRDALAAPSLTEPVYKAVERILDEKSAWIARPNDEVTKSIALQSVAAAHKIIAESCSICGGEYPIEATLFHPDGTPPRGGDDAGVGGDAESADILPGLWNAIVQHTRSDSVFWLGEILLNEITKETGYCGPAALSHQPDVAETNASAEARLREGPYNIKAIATVISLSYGEDPEADAELGRMCTADNKPVKCWEVYEEQAKALFIWFNAVLDSLSQHPHASDCDKQGPVPSGYGEYTPITVGGSTSDRTADVTVEELEAWLLERLRLITIAELARALLDAFTVGRR